LQPRLRKKSRDKGSLAAMSLSANDPEVEEYRCTRMYIKIVTYLGLGLLGEEYSLITLEVKNESSNLIALRKANSMGLDWIDDICEIWMTHTELTFRGLARRAGS
jgi:hypothetical protein